MKITQAIHKAKLDYHTNITWEFTNTENRHYLSIRFYKDASGNNHIDEFCQKVKNIWIDIIPTDEQIKLMYKMLDETPYLTDEREQEDECFDEYDYNGVKREDFFN